MHSATGNAYNLHHAAAEASNIVQRAHVTSKLGFRRIGDHGERVDVENPSHPINSTKKQSRIFVSAEKGG